jgi:hypothetical protein
MGAGAPAAGTPIGDALLAHELAHAAQQKQAAADPVARRKPIAGESAEAEADADGSMMGALAQMRAAGGRIGSVMRTDLQLQRCDESEAKAAKGDWFGKTVATQSYWIYGGVPYHGKTEIRAASWLGAQKSEAAALAMVKAQGHGCVTIERGLYVAYGTDVGFVGPGYSANPEGGGQQTEDILISPGVAAMVDNGGRVFRPGQFDPGAKDPQKTSDKEQLKDTGDPFQGYKDAFGDGKSLDKADNETLLKAVNAALKDTALTVLAQSEEEVKQKQPKFAAGTGAGGVPDNERAVIRQTASELAPVIKKIQENDTTITLLRVGGAGEGHMGNPNQDMIDRLQEENKVLAQQKRVLLSRYPMLGRFDDDGLVKFAGKKEEEQVQALGGLMPGMLKDIEKTRTNVLEGSLNLWAVAPIVDATIAGLGIQDEAKRKVVKERARSEARTAAITSIVLAVFSIGLGLAAAFTTGGLSLAMSAGALGLGLFDAVSTTDDYLVKKAASNTNPDPNQSIVHPEEVPHWGWLVVAWAGVGLDAFDVVKAVKAIGAGERSIKDAAEALAKTNAARKGMSEADLLAKLRAAAGDVAGNEVISEATRAGVAARLGVNLEIEKAGELGATECRVLYQVDAKGRVKVLGMKVGAAAQVGDVLAHAEVIRLMRRYEGLTGTLRELWDRLLSAAGKASPNGPPPFPKGSAAYNSWFELQKLPELIRRRVAKFGPHLTKEQDALLRSEVEFLENERRIHQDVVDRLVFESADNFVASPDNPTLKLCNSQGFRLPDVAKAPPLGADELLASKYYYRMVDGKPTLSRKATAGDGVQQLRARTDADGKFLGFEEGGDLTRAEKAEELISKLSAAEKTRYDKLVEQWRKLDPAARVVPIEGMSATGKTIGGVVQEFGQANFRGELIRILSEAMIRKGSKPQDAAKAAREAAEALMSHEITVVKGTEQLRAFGYRLHFANQTGKVVDDDLHHVIPLYLGGDHRVKNLVDIDGALHDELHKLVNNVQFDKNTTLAPSSIQRADLNFKKGAAILHPDGTVTLRPL